MYAVMRITGNVGGAIARTLLAKGEKVRGIVRNPEKAAEWQKQGAELFKAGYDDAACAVSQAGLDTGKDPSNVWEYETSGNQSRAVAAITKIEIGTMTITIPRAEWETLWVSRCAALFTDALFPHWRLTVHYITSHKSTKDLRFLCALCILCGPTNFSSLFSQQHCRLC